MGETLKYRVYFGYDLYSAQLGKMAKVSDLRNTIRNDGCAAADQITFFDQYGKACCESDILTFVSFMPDELPGYYKVVASVQLKFALVGDGVAYDVTTDANQKLIDILEGLQLHNCRLQWFEDMDSKRLNSNRTVLQSGIKNDDKLYLVKV